MMPVFVGDVRARSAATRSSSSSVRAYRPPERAIRYSRGTVSVLWFSTSGPASSTVRSDASLPWKSGISTSIRQPGTRARVCRIVSAKIDGAAVLQVVAIDRGDDRRTAAASARSLRRREPARARSSVGGRPCATAQYAARARADVAEDHERRRPVMPALADVRAARVLADGVQLQLAHDALEPQVVGDPGARTFSQSGLGERGETKCRGEGDKTNTV